MASINIDQPVTTPAHEWAAETTGALHDTSNVLGSENKNATGPPSLASTPGLEVPGSFPYEKYAQTQFIGSEERTPHAAATHLANAAPPKSASELQNSARGYLPNVDMQSAVDTAKSYLPASVIGAVGSVLPASMTNGQQVEKNLDPTSGAKPASVDALSQDKDNASLANASTTALPPSERSDSFACGGAPTPPSHPNPELDRALDVTSTAKPANPETGTMSISSSSTPSSAPLPSASTKSTSTPVNAANAAVAMHTLPTPPASKGGTPTRSGDATSNPSGPVSDKSQPTTNDDTFPLPNDGSRSSHPSEPSSNSNPNPNPNTASRVNQPEAPKPPPKDKPEPTPDQPTVRTTPGQEHVMHGSAMGVRVPGTAPAGGDDDAAATPLSLSTHSSLGDSHVHGSDEGAGKEKSDAGATRGAHPDSSEEDVRAGAGTGEKKEGRVKGLVHKMKDKISHRGH